MTDATMIRLLDEQPEEVTDWEAKFLETLRRQGEAVRLSPKQRAVLQRMAYDYLPEAVVLDWLRGGA